MRTAHALREPQLARPESTSDEPPGSDRPIQRLARATGLLYLVLAVFGMFSAMVLESLIVAGDAQATADSILGSRWLFGSSLVGWLAVVVADVAISVAFYLLLRPVSHMLSPLAAALRLVYSAVLAAVLLNLFDAFRLLTGVQGAEGLGQQQRQAMALVALDTFDAGFLLALVLFGVHLLMLGFLLYGDRGNRSPGARPRRPHPEGVHRRGLRQARAVHGAARAGSGLRGGGRVPPGERAQAGGVRRPHHGRGGRDQRPRGYKARGRRCDGVLVALIPRGVHGYSTGTAQAVLDHAPPGARLMFSFSSD